MQLVYFLFPVVIISFLIVLFFVLKEFVVKLKYDVSAEKQSVNQTVMLFDETQQQEFQNLKWEVSSLKNQLTKYELQKPVLLGFENLQTDLTRQLFRLYYEEKKYSRYRWLFSEKSSVFESAVKKLLFEQVLKKDISTLFDDINLIEPLISNEENYKKILMHFYLKRNAIRKIPIQEFKYWGYVCDIDDKYDIQEQPNNDYIIDIKDVYSKLKHKSNTNKLKLAFQNTN